jgi:carboxypeptidase C (cathepsin A)
VILWLNGGPGCSSLVGLIEENGPFHVKDNGNTVYENVYAWNKVGHVIYLEFPAGVGFSYSTDGNITTNDNKTAEENYNALVN